MKRGIGEGAVEGIIHRHMSQQVNWQSIQTIPLLGIGEIALKKGHEDFVVTISAINTQSDKHLLAVLPDRKKTPLKPVYPAFPPHKKSRFSRFARICTKGIATLCMKPCLRLS